MNENYRALVRAFPEIAGIKPGDLFVGKAPALPDLVIEATGETPQSHVKVSIGTYRIVNGDPVPDPEYEILTDNEKRNLTIISLTLSTHTADGSEVDQMFQEWLQALCGQGYVLSRPERLRV